jgi:hypothetical protein
MTRGQANACARSKNRSVADTKSDLAATSEDVYHPAPVMEAALGKESHDELRCSSGL